MHELYTQFSTADTEPEDLSLATSSNALYLTSYVDLILEAAIYYGMYHYGTVAIFIIPEFSGHSSRTFCDQEEALRPQ